MPKGVGYRVGTGTMKTKTGGGSSSVIVRGAGKSGLQKGIQDGDRAVGTRPFHVTNRSLNSGRRRM